MRAILVDDEPHGIRTLKKLLEFNCPEVEIAAVCADAFDAKQKIEECEPDLVFLDIRMPGKSGLDMLADLAEWKFEVIIVTAHNQYILQALHYSAVDYIMKPVDEDKLVEAVQRVKTRISKNQARGNAHALVHNMENADSPEEMRLCLRSHKGLTVLSLDEIVYCEAQRSYTVFHLANQKTILASKPLFDYDRLLEGTSFFRVHKSFLINLQHIKEYIRTGSVLMSNGKTIEVSRRKKDAFLMKVKDVFKV
jgi:two-component system, LytTR family, response regulator